MRFLDSVRRLFRAEQTAGDNSLDAAGHLAAAAVAHADGRINEAEHGYHRVLAKEPENALALRRLGLLLRRRGDFDGAEEFLREAIASGTEEPSAHEDLGVLLRDSGRIDDALTVLRRGMDRFPDDAALHSALCFARCFDPGDTALGVFEEHRRWALRHASDLPAYVNAFGNALDPERRLRIGYVSFDFENAINGSYLEDVLAAHDRNMFDVHIYNNGIRDGAWCKRLRVQGAWRDISGMDDSTVAQCVVDDRIDILVDLSGHLARNRLRMFAMRPAPVQAAWLSYPATTGLIEMDFRITDGFCDPPGASEGYYSETLARLPHTYWCYRPPVERPVGPLPALSAGQVTFGSFNMFAKVNDAVLDAWAEILRGLPGSRLLVATVPRGSASQRLRERLQARGITGDRVRIEPARPVEDFHALMGEADLMLDCFPVCGATTTLDALWNGLPVITLAGDSCVSRAGASILGNLGLDDLVTRDVDEYVTHAVELGSRLEHLANLRTGLRERLRRSPMMDAAGFTRDLEVLYRNIWRECCAAPHSIPRAPT